MNLFLETGTDSRQAQRHERDMEAARYRFGHGLTLAEVGKVLGCSRAMASRRVRRAIDSRDPRIEEWRALWNDIEDRPPFV